MDRSLRPSKRVRYDDSLLFQADGAPSDDDGIAMASDGKSRDRLTGETNAKLDKTMRTFVEELFIVQRSRPDIRAFQDLRDKLIEGKDSIALRSQILLEVVKATCPKTSLQDSDWAAFASSVLRDETETKQRKEPAAKKTDRLRTCNLATITALWSLELVDHYCWGSLSHAAMRLLRQCATKFPDFATDFLPHANAVLLARHRASLLEAKVKRIGESHVDSAHSSANVSSLNTQDIRMLAGWNTGDAVMAYGSSVYVHQMAGEQAHWLADSAGAVMTEQGKTLKELKPDHFPLYLLTVDAYGLLVPRGTGSLAPDCFEPPSPISPTLDTAVDAGTSATQHTNSLGLDGSRSTHPSRSLSRSEPATDDTASVIGTSSEPSDAPTPETNLLPRSSSPVDTESEPGSRASTVLGDSPSSPSETQLLPSTRSPSGSVSSTGPSAIVPLPGDESSATTSHHLTQNETYSANSEGDTMSSTIEESRFGTRTYSPPLEEHIWNSHREILENYRSVIHRDSSLSPQHAARARWLSHTTPMAKIFTCGLSSGSAVTEAEADVLYYSSEQFLVHAREGKIFQLPVVIKEAFADQGFHTVDTFKTILLDSYGGKKLDVRNLYHAGTKPTYTATLVRALDGKDNVRTGYNALNLRDIARPYRPLFTMLPRYRLLETLTENVGNNSGKDVQSRPVDIASCISFNILGLAGAFSGAHLDSLGGTWVRNLDGLKLWMITPRSGIDQILRELAIEGDSWDPRGQERMLILEPGDVLLMPPGVPVVHAVHSPQTSLMSGGMLWDSLSIVPTLKLVHHIAVNQQSTNEAIAYQLPEILDALEKLVKKDTTRFQGLQQGALFWTQFTDTLKALRKLGCDCSSAAQECPCSKGGRRCTSLCAGHPRLPPQHGRNSGGTTFECMLEEPNSGANCLCTSG